MQNGNGQALSLRKFDFTFHIKVMACHDTTNSSPFTIYYLLFTSHILHLTSYISHLTSHIPHLTSHISHLTFHKSPPFTIYYSPFTNPHLFIYNTTNPLQFSIYIIKFLNLIPIKNKIWPIQHLESKVMQV